MLQNIIYILLLLNIFSFLLGYLCHGVHNNKLDKTYNKLSNKNKIPVNHNITIDEKKMVVNIDTKGLEKKYDSLGEVSQSDNNINDSINKLKNLKG